MLQIVNMTSLAEENYLKAIYVLNMSESSASTNNIADRLETKASSVTDMLKRLSEKQLVDYQKYQPARLTPKGRSIAIDVIRKHRLWEYFLVEKLKFRWDEVHDIAEQLEHIQSPALINRLEEFLNSPKFDPHGDPIPNKEGKITERHDEVLSELAVNKEAHIVGVKEHSNAFLQYLDAMQLVLGTKIKLLNRFEFDQSVVIELFDAQKSITISHEISKNLFIKTKHEA